jgi:hypothetical protein
MPYFQYLTDTPPLQPIENRDFIARIPKSKRKPLKN